MAAWAGRCPSLDVNDKVLLDITFNCVPDAKALIDYAARYYDTPPTDIRSFLEGGPGAALGPIFGEPLFTTTKELVLCEMVVLHKVRQECDTKSMQRACDPKS